MLKITECAQCSNPFLVKGVPGRRPTTCSEKCRKARHADSQRRYRAAHAA